MKKLFFNPIEHPVAVKLESKILGVSKQYEPNAGGGPVSMEELFKLAATDSFDKVEVKLTVHNQAYYCDSKNPLEQVPVEGWISLKDYMNGGGYLKDRTITIKIK